MQSPPQARPGPRVRRAVARALDLALYGWLVAVVSTELVSRLYPAEARTAELFDPVSARRRAVQVLVLAGSFLLEVLPVALSGRSAGKVLLGLRVVRVDDPGRPPGLVRAVGRWLPLLAALTVPRVGLPVLVLALGWGLLDPAGRGLHDRLAGTRVVDAAGGASGARAGDVVSGPGAQERRHPPGDAPGWQEAWEFEAWDLGGRSGVLVHVSLLPARRRAWYWAGLVRADDDLVVVTDLDVPPPTVGLELRTSGLWAHHVCEQPHVHWSVANECHALGLSDPEVALGRQYGDVVPLAVDLEWEDDEAETRLLAGPADVVGYERSGRVHGEVLLHQGGAGTGLAVAGWAGRRRHWWGDPDWFERAWGEPVEGLRLPVALSDGAGRRSVLEHRLTPDGWRSWNRPTDTT